MVKNFIIERDKNKLINRKSQLVLDKRDAEEKIVRWRRRKNELLLLGPLPEDFIKEKAQWVEEVIQIDRELSEIRGKLREHNSEESVRRNHVLIHIFNEMFGEEQLQKIYGECDRRLNGEPPIKVNFDWKNFDSIKSERDKYKKLAKEQVEKMIEFRIILTKLIESGCEQFGDGEFLKFISPLNKLIIPVNDLIKIRDRNNL